jgi:hypothetical protein
MIAILNGPGLPVLDLRSGARVEAPVFSDDDARRFKNVTVYVVDPFATLSPVDFEAALYRWLPGLVDDVFLLMPRTPYEAPSGTRVLPLQTITSLSDLSRVRRIRRDACIDERIFKVSRHMESAVIKENLPEHLFLCGSSPDFAGGIPRVSPGKSLYWFYSDSDDRNKCAWTVGMCPETEVDCVLASDPKALEDAAFNKEPSSYRIVSTIRAAQDPRDLLYDGVLKLSSDERFAEAVVTSFDEMSMKGVAEL